MITIILLVLIGLGITNLIVNASILEQPRQFLIQRIPILGQLVSCLLCTGFWVGILLGLLNAVSPIYLGALVSLSGFIFGRLIDLVDIVVAYLASKIGDEDERE